MFSNDTSRSNNSLLLFIGRHMGANIDAIIDRHGQVGEELGDQIPEL